MSGGSGPSGSGFGEGGGDDPCSSLRLARLIGRQMAREAFEREQAKPLPSTTYCCSRMRTQSAPSSGRSTTRTRVRTARAYGTRA